MFKWTIETILLKVEKEWNHYLIAITTTVPVTIFCTRVLKPCNNGTIMRERETVFRAGTREGYIN